jgi:putative protease
MDAAKSMGELVGTVASIGRGSIEVRLNKGVVLGNGDGFSFVSRQGKVEGFRGDVCSGNTIRCKILPTLFTGALLYRNINAAFENELERSQCTRMIAVSVSMKACLHETGWTIETVAESEDGRRIETSYDAGDQTAGNMERMRDILKSQISKNAGSYSFNLSGLEYQENLPLMSASSVNAIRRDLAARMDMLPCGKKDLLNRNSDQRDKGTLTIPEKQASYKNNISNRLSQTVYQDCGAESIEPAYELLHNNEAELMRTRYCIRYELGICPKHHGSKENRRLFLLNNGQRFALHFDCRNCEMTVKEGYDLH